MVESWTCYWNEIAGKAIANRMVVGSDCAIDVSKASLPGQLLYLKEHLPNGLRHKEYRIGHGRPP